MTEPTTPTGKAVYYNRHEDGTPDIFINWLVKAEREAAAAERERLRRLHTRDGYREHNRGVLSCLWCQRLADPEER